MDWKLLRIDDALAGLHVKYQDRPLQLPGPGDDHENQSGASANGCEGVFFMSATTCPHKNNPIPR